MLSIVGDDEQSLALGIGLLPRCYEVRIEGNENDFFERDRTIRQVFFQDWNDFLATFDLDVDRFTLRYRSEDFCEGRNACSCEFSSLPLTDIEFF